MKERCKEILERAYVLLDGEVGFLSEEERLEIEQHLEECHPCLERHGLDREVLELIHRLRSQGPTCPDALRSRISSLLQEL